MIETPLMIPIDEVGGERRLYLDYVSGEATPVKKILGGFGRSDRRWGRGPGIRKPKNTWSALIERLVAYNRSLGVEGAVIDKMLRSRDDSGVLFVVTGQQPGALGGPLLALHKLATAIALAEWVERTEGAPCVPLFWVGSDDADFQEIREVFLVDCDLTPFSTSIEEGFYTAASPVGDIPPQALRRVWESIEPLISRCPAGGFVTDLVRPSLEGAGDHGGVTARILAGLCGGRAAMVDGREPAVRECAKALFLRFFDREAELRETAETAGRSLESHGYHAQLRFGPDSGVFMMDEGRRKKVTDERRAGVREALSADVTRFSPGVALRNLVQDHVFRPVAVVLGPAEVAYRAQLDPVYRDLGVERPLAFPRMQATYLPPQVAALAEAGGVVQLLSDPLSFVNHVYAANRPGKIAPAADRFHSTFEAEVSSFLGAARGELDDRTLERTRKKLADLSRRLGDALDVGDKVGKAAALKTWPFLEHLPRFIRSNDRPQDRYLSALAPFTLDGQKAGSSLSAAASAFVQAALDGRPRHVVYSSQA